MFEFLDSKKFRFNAIFKFITFAKLIAVDIVVIKLISFRIFKSIFL